MQQRIKNLATIEGGRRGAQTHKHPRGDQARGDQARHTNPKPHQRRPGETQTHKHTSKQGPCSRQETQAGALLTPKPTLAAQSGRQVQPVTHNTAYRYEELSQPAQRPRTRLAAGAAGRPLPRSSARHSLQSWTTPPPSCTCRTTPGCEARKSVHDARFIGRTASALLNTTHTLLLPNTGTPPLKRAIVSAGTSHACARVARLTTGTAHAHSGGAARYRRLQRWCIAAHGARVCGLCSHRHGGRTRVCALCAVHDHAGATQGRM
jgi:hypothetical protein